jgi:RNA polymerase sigma factor (TIGR02999 family)
VEHDAARPDGELEWAVYKQLRLIAAHQMQNERAGHTLTATALVNEAFVRLGPGMAADRARFLHAAGEAMRRVLIDHARRRGAEKRGAGWMRSIQSLDEFAERASESEAVALDQAFVRLEAEDARAAEVVRLRFFAGLDMDQTSQVLGVSRRSVFRDWDFARTFLLAALQEQRE